MSLLGRSVSKCTTFVAKGLSSCVINPFKDIRRYRLRQNFRAVRCA